ncbi:type VI secretion protein IcmF/TssM N-terminal domain-containing protein [Hyalangium versicolor]|uniref:type VI secretion protein IcmF/TssM N-terminal domain-containing protein n=1 Tax=Hyalangium versicolor TaxID=2861190 RepID=UPI001CCFEA26|nr:type VI secretion protein IcmF/TssM N-terminal domain-containing protein [Hyalangium versicolor]
MVSQLLFNLATLVQAAADPAKAVGEGVKALEAGAKAVDSGAQSADTGTSSVGKIWNAVSPYLIWVLVVIGVVLLGFLGWKLWGWWRSRRSPARVASGPPPMSTGRLMQVRNRFLYGLPLAHRAAVVDLPNVVVLGPAGSGKTQLIGLDVDWQRQARQFLPSYTDDPLLQIYLGPDCVVQEVSAPLLEDETLQARGALRKMWRKCFSHKQKGVAVLALDVRWLADTPPDEQRRMAQLLRGKLNIMSEARGAPVETRLCLTHMDGLEGFEDFARMLRQHGVGCAFDIPKQGEEGRLASLLDGQEQFLALGLTSLPVDAFERLERFYSQGGRSFAALGRFVTALLESNTLSYKPQLTRVYLSSPTPEARASGTLSVASEDSNIESLRRLYLRTHLQRAALIAAVCCLPVIFAYGRFYWLLRKAQAQVQGFEATVAQMREQGIDRSGEVVEAQVNEAAERISHLWRFARWWPPLNSSFPDEMLDLRRRLAQGVREIHLRPFLEYCHKTPQDCRPEQVVYLLATLHASKSESLGSFVNSSVKPQNSRRWEDGETSAPGVQASASSDQGRTWISALELSEPLVSTYVLASDEPWERNPPCRRGAVQVSGTADEDWSCWPYAERLTFEGQLKPWFDHLMFLKVTLESGPKGLGDLDLRREERERLKAQLADLDVFASLSTVLSQIDASKIQMNTKQFLGIESTVQVLDWLRANRDTLAAILNMEEEAFSGFQAVEKMSPSELLTRDGLWLSGNNKGPYHIELLQQNFEFRPPQLSRELLKTLLDSYEASGRLSAAQASQAGQMLLNRTAFETDLKPLVEDFTQRLKNAQLPTEVAAKREEYVQKRVNSFSRGYREALFQRIRDYHFLASRSVLLDELASVTQPSSRQVDMLRDVANRANLEPLEGPYYEPLRNAVAPFRPIVQIMAADKNGFYAALAPYQALIAQMHDDLDPASKSGGAGGDKEGKPKAAAEAPTKGKAAGGSGAEGAVPVEESALPELADFITPLEKVALSMLLEEENSYLRKAQEWLDQQGITGELRQPFLEPFLQVQALGKQELEKTLAKRWTETTARMLGPMLERYPFNPESQEDVDPGELEVLRRKDGAFWTFVHQVYSRVCVERGSDWGLRGPLRDKLALPDQMLVSLSRLGRLSKLLWDDDGKPRPLMLKVQPQPLPPPPMPGVFVTMSSLKCGKTTAYGFNQSPTWQEFPVSWWDQQVSSIVLELRSPARDAPQYLSLPWNRSAWSCFRLFEEAALTTDQRRQWSLALQGNNVNKRGLEISFGLKGDPWVPFREVPR